MEFDDSIPLGPPNESRLVWERSARAMIRRMFEAALRNSPDTLVSLWAETREQGEWYTVAVWCGLPNTLKELLREIDQ